MFCSVVSLITFHWSLKAPMGSGQLNIPVRCNAKLNKELSSFPDCSLATYLSTCLLRAVSSFFNCFFTADISSCVLKSCGRKKRNTDSLHAQQDQCT